jgi:hypothetical protein
MNAPAGKVGSFLNTLRDGAESCDGVRRVSPSWDTFTRLLVPNGTRNRRYGRRIEEWNARVNGDKGLQQSGEK